MFFSVLCLLCLCARLFKRCLVVGKGRPLGSRLWCLTVSLLLSHWYPGSGVVLDCIDSLSLHPDLLWCCWFSKSTFFSSFKKKTSKCQSLDLEQAWRFVIMSVLIWILASWNVDSKLALAGKALTWTYEPRHEISNNVVCATSKASDQPAHTRSLIRAFASRLNILWLFSYWPNIIWSF